MADDDKVSAARTIALEALGRVRKGQAADDALVGVLAARGATKIEDRALALEMTYGVLRWQRRLDAALAKHWRSAPEDPALLDILRLAAHSLMFLDRIPAHAAVSTAVEAAKAGGFGHASGFVNAVLRGLAKAPRPAAPTSSVSRAELAAWTSFPDWMVDRFEAIAGDSLPALLSSMNVPAPLTLRAVGDRDALLADLAAAGISAKPGTHAPAAVLVDGGNPASFPGFAEGRFAIQDEAAQLVTLLLGDLKAQELLDCCAAPGGKAIHAAQLGARVLAVDASAKRLALVTEAAARLHTSIETLPGQVAESGVPGLGDRRFSRVLVDAPCSGTGILRRKPDIKWARRPEELSRLAGSQRAILEGAAKHLAPGGRLVYAVCSLLRDEGEAVVEPFLKAHPELRKGEVPATFRTADGWFRSRPDLHGTDGFFAAVLER